MVYLAELSGDPGSFAVAPSLLRIPQYAADYAPPADMLRATILLATANADFLAHLAAREDVM